MKSYMFESYHCARCACANNGECLACSSHGAMINPDTGEYIDDAVLFVQDWTGRTLTMCAGLACQYGAFCEDDGLYHANYIYNNSDGCYYSEAYAAEPGSGLAMCENCGEWFDEDEGRYTRSGAWCCGGCVAEYDNPICGYHWHEGEYRAIGDTAQDGPTIGLEWEVDGFDWEDRGPCAVALDEEFFPHFVYEEDSSLEYGFEIISQPHTVPALDDIDWEYMASIIRRHGAAINPKTTGLHLHFDRDWFADKYGDTTETLARLIINYRNNWDTLLNLSGRQSLHKVDVYAARPYGGGDIYEVIENNSGDRYLAINLENTYTVEFRLGSGLVDADYLRAWVHLHIDMVKAARAGQDFTVNDNYTITPITRAAAA